MNSTYVLTGRRHRLASTNSLRQSCKARSRTGGAAVEYLLAISVLILPAIAFAHLIAQNSNFSLAESTQSALTTSNATTSTATPSNDQSTPPDIATADSPVDWTTLPVSILLVICSCGVAGLFFYQRFKTRKKRPKQVVFTAEMFDRMREKRQIIRNVLKNDWAAVMQGKVKVEEIMSPEIISVSPTDCISKIRDTFHKEQIHHVLVLDDNKKLLGIIRERDIDANDITTGMDIMIKDPVTVAPESDVNLTLSILIHKRISALPVVDDGVVKGIVTATDMLTVLQCTLNSLFEISHSMDAAPWPKTNEKPGPAPIL